MDICGGWFILINEKNMTHLDLVYIFILMVFFHIVDDFVLQTACLSKLKQKELWQEICGENFSKYKNDYKMALFIHALSWSIAIILPFIIFNVKTSSTLLLTMIVFNTIIHALIDHIKANKKETTLVADQIIHFLQIFLTFAVVGPLGMDIASGKLFVPN